VLDSLHRCLRFLLTDELALLSALTLNAVQSGAPWWGGRVRDCNSGQNLMQPAMAFYHTPLIARALPWEVGRPLSSGCLYSTWATPYGARVRPPSGSRGAHARLL